MAKRLKPGFSIGVFFVLWSTGIFAQDAQFTDREIQFFENKIRPVLIEHCLECHGDNEAKLRGGLRLTSRAQMITGGDSGSAILPGSPDESILIHALEYEDFEMPPSGKLPPTVVDDFRQWIEMGAPDPRQESKVEATNPVDIESGKDFWSFMPRAQPAPPVALNDPDWALTEIDRFILAKLESENVRPSNDTNRSSLLRRVYLTLIGLPPTPDEIKRFSKSQGSLEEDLAEVIDRLLASDHFGERWGRHWLDVARFAESSGGGRSLMFPHAWRFRDYVIDSYNADKPFDQFITEQIAGDLLPHHTFEQRYQQVVATGFLALGPTNYEQQDKELLQMEVVDEQVDTVGRAFLSLTLGCARCHDHKFDPIPTNDYYALAGIFSSTKSLVDGNVSSYVETTLVTDKEKQQLAQYKKKVARLTRELELARKRVQVLGGDVSVAEKRTRQVPVDELEGMVLDNTDATLVGKWKASVAVPRYVGMGYVHDDKQPKGKNSATFSPKLESGGHYEVRLAYSPGGNRASNVPVTIVHQDGTKTIFVNQSVDPEIDGVFVSLGTYRFEANNIASITISNDDTDGVVIVDAVQFIFRGASDAQPETVSRAESIKRRPASHDEEKEIPSASEQLGLAKKAFAELDQELKKLKKNPPRPKAVAMSVIDVSKPTDGRVHIRGSVRNLGEKVPRGFIQVLCSSERTNPIDANASGRLELAKWITHPDHPLTTRVYVNRIWRNVFGRGIVETTDNFGKMGQRPSHPELLDYLANQFVEDGWSTKKLIRKLLMSRVFRLDSLKQSESQAVDPENRLLWRANRRRLEAEALRDSVLSVSGQLDLQAGGPTIRKLAQYDLGYEFDSRRRSVYVPAFRNSMLDLFEVFDIANPNLVTGNRNTSTLPTQALYLMNSPWIIEQSKHAAERLLSRQDSDSLPTENLIDLAYLTTVGRHPTDTEMEMTAGYLSRFEDQQEGFTHLYHSLFACLDFRYLN